MTDPFTSLVLMQMELIRHEHLAQPTPNGWLLHSAVPRYRLVRQWDSYGRLWVWVNRDWLWEAVRAAWPSNSRPLAVEAAWGLPVYDMDEDD